MPDEVGHLELAALDAGLLAVARSINLLGWATPRDVHVERARLLSDFRRGQARLPSWTYDALPGTHDAAVQRLDSLEGSLRAIEATPVGPLYRARALELRLEVDAARSVGERGFAALATARFGPGDLGAEADALAARWLSDGGAGPAPCHTLASDDRDPRSLLSRLRAEVSRRRLPFAVRTNPSMCALAAISGDTLWVAEGREVTALDVDRTIVHEIEAHALPRVRALGRPGIFAIGTARGNDDQEGYGLWLEQARDVSSPVRRQELAARHVACVEMRREADFVAVVRALSSRGVELERALRAAERAFRGSHGASPGLGREQVYLESYLRVTRHLEERPEDEATLSAGQVAVSAIATLAAHSGVQTSSAPAAPLPECWTRVHS